MKQGGKPRHVVLTGEGRTFLCAAGGGQGFGRPAVHPRGAGPAGDEGCASRDGATLRRLGHRLAAPTKRIQSGGAATPERVDSGFGILVEDVKDANWHFHQLCTA